ncbi:hypothetical protein GCM10011376_00480 [Nocardioides flavus (ex Wang et al. 2016)]|uniref:Glycosyltransferase 2-like domain-containing protein n=1 Tax=Nocardioides flavus (ex Wang et al. 2016) TaxID=2058780 RepID=A0ABQ3HEZ7_9ACTN|nr:glycosyltransferase [Nocardioides flavus (ex Wang et al. 2016)]GHE14890.1 hypothetical protein GCM10011376_00480 [Nocardioides flavus (ex Wang et al. 2016)]
MNTDATDPEHFSVVIPTLQMSPLLPNLLRLYDDHPLVDEVIVINNSTAPLDLHAAKLRILDQESNIFVNPAWNLGAQTATSPLLAISNDDILIEPELLDSAAERLLSGAVGIIGGDIRLTGVPRGRPRFSRVYRRPEGFGVLMLMRTENYVPIPDELKIWQGDDYLFHRQSGHNYCFRGFRLETPHHVTAGRAEFNAQKADDFALYMRDHHRRSSYWSQPGLDFRALRMAIAVRRLLRPLPTTWQDRRGAR